MQAAKLSAGLLATGGILGYGEPIGRWRLC